MTGRILEFNVDRQRLIRKQSCDFTGLVAGSVGYLQAKFYFSKEWDDCAKVATFGTEQDGEYPMLLDESDICNIPAEALKNEYFFVKVLGGKPAYRLETNRLKIKQEVT